MTDLVPDLAEARRFLTALTGEENPLVCWQTFHDNKSAPDDQKRKLAACRNARAAAMLAWLVSQNDAGAGVYVTVNETDGRGRELANVKALRSLFVDSDGTPMPTTWALPPSIIVQRDPTHWHAYWLLRPGEPLERFSRAQAQIAHSLNTDISIKDLTRVMRVPGFLHRKNPAEAIAVHLVHVQREPLFSIDEVIEAYPLPAGIVLNDKGQQVREGVRPPSPATNSAPARPPRDPDELSDHDYYLLMTRKLIPSLDRTPGSGNSRGGQDNTAFYLACECQGRGLTFDEALDLVLDYLQGCQYDDAQGGAQRIVRSAYSQNRTATLPKRPARPRAAGSISSSSTPPPPGQPPADAAAGDAGDDGKKPPNPFQLDLAKLEKTWAISDRGVWPIEYSSRNQCYEARPNKRVCDLPIWPVRSGIDVAGGPAWWEVAWYTPHGETQRAWLREDQLKSGIDLVALPGAPVVKRHCEATSAWLTAARIAVTQPTVTITTRVGWCGRGDARSWVWPSPESQAKQTYIGADLAPAGDLARWREGVDHLLALSDDEGFPALAVLGFSIGSAFTRLLGARNPVLGLMHASSSGKGSALAYAVSAWCNPDILTLPASSTAKGVQDRGHALPDSPIWLDELQQLAEKDLKLAADALYYLANGQRRVTSSKEQQATGGERRYGCGFYAAEAPVLPGQNRGVLYRVIELTGPVCPDQATAEKLQRSAQAYGALAGPISTYIASKPVSAWRDELEAVAAAIRPPAPPVDAQAPTRSDAQRPLSEDLKGDDAKHLAILRAGLDALFSALQVQPESDSGAPLAAAITTWLSARVIEQRRNASDRETEALFALLTMILSGRWGSVDEHRPTRLLDPFGICELMVSGDRAGYVAWRAVLCEDQHPRRGEIVQLEVNPSAEGVRRLMTEQGGEARLLAAWSRHGWIRRDGRHLKVQKTHLGRKVGRVIAFTEAAFRLYGAASEGPSDLPSPPSPAVDTPSHPTRTPHPPHTPPHTEGHSAA